MCRRWITLSTYMIVLKIHFKTSNTYIYRLISVVGRHENFSVKGRVRIGAGHETRRGVRQNDVQHC